jgi:hypothetical protein
MWDELHKNYYIFYTASPNNSKGYMIHCGYGWGLLLVLEDLVDYRSLATSTGLTTSI